MSASSGDEFHHSRRQPGAETGPADAVAPATTHGSSGSAGTESGPDAGHEGTAGAEAVTPLPASGSGQGTEGSGTEEGAGDVVTPAAQAPTHGSAASAGAESGPESDPEGAAGSTATTEMQAASKPDDRGTTHYVKRSKATPWLLGLFVLALLGAFLVYPRRSAVYRPSPLTIVVHLAGTDGAIVLGIHVRPKTAKVFSVDFDLLLLESRNASAIITIALPHGIAPGSCPDSNTNGERCSYSALGPGTYLQGVAALRPSRQVVDATFGLTLKSPELTWSANGLTAEAQLPIVTAVTLPNHAALDGATPVEITYDIPDARRYDWTGGTPPDGASAKGVVWNEPLQLLSTPQAVSGTDNSSVEFDSILTLVAGTLLGVAGAALVGALQELTHGKEDIGPAAIPKPSQTVKG